MSGMGMKKKDYDEVAKCMAIMICAPLKLIASGIDAINQCKKSSASKKTKQLNQIQKNQTNTKKVTFNCGNCGGSINTNDAFCPNCGYKILWGNKKYQNQDTEELLDKIDYMSGQEFEDMLIEVLLPSEGYININGTSYTGDYGVDIVAETNGIKCAIQCKRFNSKVSIKAIQEIVAGKKHYRCDKAIVITNNYYTKNAKELAFDNKVELLDRDDIIKMIRKMKIGNY